MDHQPQETLLSLELDTTEYNAAVEAKEAAAVARYGNPRARGANPYQVEICDACGPFDRRVAWTFEKVVELGNELLRMYPPEKRAWSPVLNYANLGLADIDTNGLTEEENERC